MAESKKIPQNVKALGVVSLLNDASSEMMIPLLPAFITGVLGLGPAFLGALEGIAESTASILKLVSGWYSDRVRKRKALTIAGYSLSNLIRPFIGLATAGWQVLFFRFADRVGKGIRTSPRDALIADTVSQEERGKAYGFQRMMDNLGAAIGPLIASLLLFLFTQQRLRLIFLLSFIPGVLAVLVLVFFVKESKARERPRTESTSKPTPLAGGLPAGSFRTYLFAVVLFTLGNSSDVFLVLKAQSLGVSLALVPILWMVLSLVKAVANTPGGIISDRIGRKPSILIGWAIYGLVYFGFAAATTTWHVWALFVIYGLYYGMVEGPERALVADLVAEDKRGSAFGWFHLSVGIGALPASLIFGLIWKSFSASAAFTFGAIMALAGAAVLLSIKSFRNP